MTVGPEMEQLYKMRDRNQIHFAILDHNDKYYKLDETKRFINFSIIHVNYTYDQNGKEYKKTSYFPLKDCTKEDFS